MTGREDEPSGRGSVNGQNTSDTPGGRLPPISRGSSRDFPGLSADFRVDILDHEKEVIVVAELPGAEKDAIVIRLLNPQTLRVTARRAAPAMEDYSIHERGDGTLSRLVRLPASVVGEGAVTGFKNGILEVRLKKMGARPESGGREVPIT